MKKIAVINDLSGMGKCSLTAAIPVISVMGVQACPLPTAVLSNQTGYPSYFCDDFTDRMDAVMEEWKKLRFVPDGIFTGYLAGEAQAEKIHRFLELFAGEKTRILIDPVMGDGGRTYAMYSDGFARKMRGLVGKAQVITPNLTEALLLLYDRKTMQARWQEIAGMPREERKTCLETLAKELVKRYDLQAAVITGIDIKQRCETDSEQMSGSRIGNLICENGRCQWITGEKIGGSYSGTGDLFASIMAAGLICEIPLQECAQKAVEFLTKGIRDAAEAGTDRNDGICFEPYLHELGAWAARLLPTADILL